MRSAHRREHPEDGRRLAGLYGDHPARGIGAGHGQVELAGDHGDAEPEGEQPELREPLQSVEDVEGGQPAPADQRRAPEGGEHDEQRHGGQENLRPRREPPGRREQGRRPRPGGHRRPPVERT
jgi:hypothetical protein